MSHPEDKDLTAEIERRKDFAAETERRKVSDAEKAYKNEVDEKMFEQLDMFDLAHLFMCKDCGGSVSTKSMVLHEQFHRRFETAYALGTGGWE